jgi:SAM-dependent methyltransferase
MAQDDRTGMRAYWDPKARENPMWFIHSQLDYAAPDAEEFWRSGEEALESTLATAGARLTPADRVLEIGCGIGRMTRAIAARAGSVVGVDVSAEMIERGRAELDDLGNVELVVGSGRDLSGQDDAAFDVVYSFIVFQHIPDPAVTCAYIPEIGRVLRPGGWTVFQVSEEPAVHSRTRWSRGERSMRAFLDRRRGRRAGGCLAPEWLGSAVSHRDLLDALARGGLDLVATSGEGTQFCLVHARRPG